MFGVQSTQTLVEIYNKGWMIACSKIKHNGKTEQPLRWLLNRAKFEKYTFIVLSSGIVLIV